MLRETTIENGKVRGVACGWPSITAYYGIPYAAPPVGNLRWREPQPAADWDGVRDCARPSAKCWQLGVGKGSFFEREFYPVEEEMSEDCLYLNVWTPAQSTEERCPVIFWIHGGAFMTGYGHSAHFDGEHFASQGVRLVP
ncbi:MAG: carboxylesterase family protein, partial [Lachnospiraceae bacterium]|nr:carboxylesterase family protein [Lachnospiraceae bacterium]